MRWLSFGPATGERAGVLLSDGGVLDIAGQWPYWPRGWRALLAANLLNEVDRRARRGEFAGRFVRDAAELVFAPPVVDPSKIICLGRNYGAHAAEQQGEAPGEPLLFAKAVSALTAHDTAVIVPAHESRPDYEAELAIVIGCTTRTVSPEEARNCMAGITAFNDVSGREAQFRDKLWLRGKSFDTFAPVGPWVTTLDEAGNPDDLRLAMRVNGEVRQAARTSEMTVDCASIVAYISRQMTLYPGDLIATGTARGVGVFREPPVFLQDGDVMEVELESVGVLRNWVVRH